jgi:hypothetical protein
MTRRSCVVFSLPRLMDLIRCFPCACHLLKIIDQTQSNNAIMRVLWHLGPRLLPRPHRLPEQPQDDLHKQRPARVIQAVGSEVDPLQSSIHPPHLDPTDIALGKLTDHSSNADHQLGRGAATSQFGKSDLRLLRTRTGPPEAGSEPPAAVPPDPQRSNFACGCGRTSRPVVARRDAAASQPCRPITAPIRLVCRSTS